MDIRQLLFSAAKALNATFNDPGVQAALAQAEAGHVDWTAMMIAIGEAAYKSAGSPSPAAIIAAIESLIHPAAA